MIYQFDPFQLDLKRFELRASGAPVAVEPQTLHLLAFLVEHRDRLVTRDDIVQAIWQGRAVSDWAIAAAIKSARLALGDTGPQRRFIKTVHGKGFRFIAPVTEPEVTDETAPEPLSLIVLPFETTGPDPDHTYFADGLTEDLITDLSKVMGLTVASRHASFHFRSQRDPQTILTTLPVSHILDGALRRQGDMLRLNVQLTDAKTGQPLWSGRFSGGGADVFALQDDICARIVGSLRLQLTAPSKPQRNPQAYDECLRGRAEYYRYAPPNMARAQDHFQAAITLDPGYAEAYAYLSYCRCACFVFSWPGSDTTLDPSIQLAKKAIVLDDTSAIAHARLGWVLGYVNRPTDCIASFERAIALDPASAEAFHAYGETMNRLSRPDLGLPLLQKAFALETFMPPSWPFTTGHSYTLMHRYDQALAQFLPVLDHVPRFIPARVQLARLYAEMGEAEKATETVTVLRDFAPRYTLKTAHRMFPYPDAGDRDRLDSALRAAGLPD